MLDIVVCEIAGLERHRNPVHTGSGAFFRAETGWCRNASGSRRHEGATIKRCHMNLPDFIKSSLVLLPNCVNLPRYYKDNSSVYPTFPSIGRRSRHCRFIFELETDFL